MTPVQPSGSSEHSGADTALCAGGGCPPAESAFDSTKMDHPGFVPTAETPPAFFFIFTALAALLIWMAWIITQRPAKNMFSPEFAAHVTQSTIDPNTASWASLVRIPDIGPARAEKLIAWRKAHQTMPSQIVFHSLADLRRIPSFGPKTVAGISQYLRFPSSKPSHRPVAPMGSGSFAP